LKTDHLAARLGEIIKQNGAPARGALSAFFAWAIREGIADENPVTGTNDPATTLVDLRTSLIGSQHVAKFILVALYTGTRDGRVAGPGARSDLRGRAGAGHRCGTRCRTITGFGVAASTLRPILGIGAGGRRGRVRAPLLIVDYLNRTVWGRHIRRGDI
jgi:hypothetical protein